MSSTNTIKLVLLGILFILIAVVVISFLIPDAPTQQYMLDFLYWIKNVPRLYGSIILTSIYAVSLVFCFPGTPINLAAGFLFGVWVGSAVTVTGCDIGAILSYLLGRTLGRDWAQNQLMDNKKFALINLAIEKNAWVIIFLMRLSPVVPFGLCNYLFGVTKVGFVVYWTATTAGLIPCTIAYTYLGSLMRNLTDIYSDEGDDQQLIIIVVGVVITVLGIIVITAVTKRTLDRTIEEQAALVGVAELLGKNGEPKDDFVVVSERTPLLVVRASGSYEEPSPLTVKSEKGNNIYEFWGKFQERFRP